MICFLCKNESDAALCKACSAKLAALMPRGKAPHVVKQVVKLVQRDERSYWRVEVGDFVAIIDGRDAKDEHEAYHEARDPLTRWYYVGDDTQPLVFRRILRITHNEFVDWLRQGKRSLFVRTT